MSVLKMEYHGTIAILTINHPEKYNCISTQTLEALEAAADRLAQDDELRCLIITGGGEKSFVAGADTTQLSEMGEAEGLVLGKMGNRVMMKIQQLPMPVIAAVSGFALGGGCELALSCDIRIAANTASFGLPEVTLGLIPGWGGTQRMPRLVGYSIAAELMFTGSRIHAQRALDLGLVNAVVEPEQLMETALEMAEIIAANAPLAVRAVKRTLLNSMDSTMAAGITNETYEFSKLFETQDAKTGLDAINNKSRVFFSGK